MKTLAVIPARYASTRLPGKPLIEIAGIPLVVRVLENVSKCSNVDRVIVATDDERIAELVSRHGGEAVMTPPELPSGGDRVAYVARRVPSDYVLNVQVDDPLVGADMIDPLVASLDADPSVMLALLVKRIERMEEVEDTSVVKAVFDARGRALYFSRSPIPYPRNSAGCPVWEHLGIYAFTKEFLLKLVSLPPTPLMQTESLEQLRILEHGYSMAVIPTKYPSEGPNVNTIEDLEEVRRIFAQRKNEEK